MVETLDLITAEEKAHAPYGASNSLRWLRCPGSIRLSEQAPEPPESKYAAEGTRAHACLEFLLKNRHEWDEALRVARKNFEPEMITHAVAAIEYIEGRLAELPGAELLCETQVDASPFTCPGQFGTLDVSLVQEFGRLVVVDYKYGAGHAVDPDGPDGRGNSQMVYYGLALSHQYDHNFSEVELVIIQPRAFHESGETVRSFVMTMDELLAWELTFKNGVLATMGLKPKLAAGEWCRWCPAKVLCPELKSEGMTKARVTFKDSVGVQSVPEPRMIKAADLGTILEGCERLEEWIGAVRAYAFTVLDRGGKIPGYKLVDKRAMRKWADEAAAGEFLGDVPGVFCEPELLSPAQVVQVLKNFGYPKVDAEQMVDQFCARESSGKTMVPDSDKRAAVVDRKSLLTALD